MRNRRFSFVGVAIFAVIVIVSIIRSKTGLLGSSFTASLAVDDSYEWNQVSTVVTEGDADEFSVQIVEDKEGRIKVTYDGDYDLTAEIRLKDTEGHSVSYELMLYEEYDTTTEQLEVKCDLTEIE